MTEATVPAPQTPSLSRQVGEALAARPAELAIGLYAVVAVGATVAAYLTVFTQFAPYDDEGTLLVTLKAFAQGDVLYRDIWSVYGPFYYEVFGAFFALTGQAVTTNASRTIVVVIWVGTSLLFGLAAHRLSGRLALGLTGMAAAFATLGVLATEPMHPQVMCVLLLGAFALLAAAGPTSRVALAGGGCGALVAALLLTKVNLGLFAFAAVALAAALTIEPVSRRAWLRLPVVLAFLAMPAAVLVRDLEIAWVRELLLLEVLAASAVVVAGWPRGDRAEHEDSVPWRWLLGAIGGFAGAFTAIVVVIFITGSSPTDVYDGVVTRALGIRDLRLSQFNFPSGAAVDWAVASVAVATLAAWLRRTDSARPSPLWTGLLRALAGLAILLTIAHIVPIAFNPSSGNPVVVPMLLAWVAVLPPTGAGESAYKRFLRVLLPALAVAQTLQVYPVPGSQMGIAAVSFVPVGALCLADALVDLRAWSSSRGERSLTTYAAAASVGSVALAGMFALNAIVLPAATNVFVYREQPKLALPGADLLHLPEPSVAEYSGLVGLLDRYGCSTFVGYPSVDSLYLWSGREAPPPQIPNAWMNALDEDQQQRIVDRLRASRRTCAIRNDNLAESYLHGAPPPDKPLVNYVLNGFKPVAEIGESEFLLPK